MQPIGPDLWHVRGPDVKLPGGARMPVHATVARLPDRTLVLYSPCKLDDATAAAIEREGEVAHVIAPNLLHHLYAGEALARWPRATFHAPPGLATKRPDLPPARSLHDAEPAWESTFAQLAIAGAPTLDETVLLHRASGTLLCADLLFNITEPANIMTKLVLAMMGVGGRELRQSRAWKMFAKDKAATRSAFAALLAWPIRQVAPVHGPATSIDAAALAPRLRLAPG